MSRVRTFSKLTDQGYRIQQFEDSETGEKSTQIQYMVPGEIISVNENRLLPTSTGKGFYVANVVAKFPNGEQKGTALIWENQYKSDKLSEGTWAPGAPIKLAVNADKGEHFGKASVELPSSNPFNLEGVMPEMDEDTIKAMEEAGVDTKSFKINA